MSTGTFEPGAWLEGPDGVRTAVARACSMGRSRTNQVVLADMRVSRRHALIQVQQPGEYWIVDFGTVNGTRVDGRRIAVPTRLHDGSRIEIGGSLFVFRETALRPVVGHDTVSNTATMHDVRRIPVWLLVTDIIDSTTFYKSVPSEKLPQLVGQWFSKCRELMDASGGYINQYLGDGFFGHWGDVGGAVERVGRAMKGLCELQKAGSPLFRWVLHRGDVLAAGSFSPSEESMMGPDMHFVFRMEAAAKQLGKDILISEAAAVRMGDSVKLIEAGRTTLKGFDQESVFFTLEQ